MRSIIVLNALGALILALSASMILPGIVAAATGDGTILSWAGAIALCGASGAALLFATRGHRFEMRRSEGFAVVAFGWFAAGIFGAIPFLLSGTIPSVTDAFFETMSGFTTTGATILVDVESLPPSMLFWRSLTHWIGGMGIIVLSLAVLPFLGVGGMQLFRAEVPGPTPDRLRPRIRETAKLLWGVYVTLTAAETVALVLAGMGWLDAACHAFGTLGTGGFSTRNASVGAFENPMIEWIIIFFMFAAGANFTLHFHLIREREPRRYLRDPEFRFYAWTILGATAFVTALLHLQPGNGGFGDNLRNAAFQVISLGTTTGYGTADFELWPYTTHVLFLMLMIMGGSAGSTGGGVKVVRVMLILQHARLELRRLLHPRAVIFVKHGHHRVPGAVIRNVLGFFLLYLAVHSATTFALTLWDVDLVTATSASIATLSNIGPGLGDIGPTDNYAWFPSPAKWLLSMCMLLGRLEIYTVLVLFVPEIWRR